MIYWKAKYGWANGNISSINDINFIDDGFWAIQEIDDIPDNTYRTEDVSDISWIYNTLGSILGTQVDSLYLTPIGYSINWKQETYDIIKLAVPSVTKNAPNLQEYLLTQGATVYCYIPTLSICFRYTDQFYGQKVIGDSLSENSWVFLPTIGRNNISINRSVCSIFPLCIRKYIEPASLIDNSNYRYINSYLLFSTTGYFNIEVGTISPGEYLSKELNYVFGENPKEPDGKIDFPSNPYEPGGPSGEGGGGGTFDGDSDQISDSSLPPLSSADTGFTRLYTPTLSQVQALARYLWTDESIVETLWNVVKRYFEDPMQAFISFSIVPVPVPVSGQEEFKVLFIPTGVMLNTVANQFVDVDCGTFDLKEYYGSALDYSPNTKVSCYLPYIGTVSLNTDDIMGRTLQVKYRVDICSGSCVAKVLVDGNVIYQFPGCCSIPIPFSSSDFSSYGSAIISAVKTGVAVASAGAGMAELGASIVGMDASQQSGKSITTTVQTARNPSTGRQITTGTEKVTKEIIGTEASLSGIAQTGISNTANSVTASKTIVERSGSFSGNSGYLGVRRPYLIIERPRMCMPANYQSLNGFPSMITLELGSCKGFTRVQQVQLTGLYATNPEQAEILQLLKSGVIF